MNNLRINQGCNYTKSGLFPGKIAATVFTFKIEFESQKIRKYSWGLILKIRLRRGP